MPSASPNPAGVPAGEIQLFDITVAGASLSLTVHPLVGLALALLIVIAIAVIWRRSDRERVIAVTVDIPLGGIGRLTVNSDREVARLAHQAWIEIATRKAGLPLDEENDVIDEVFNSWYELFRQMRDISKNVPPPSLRTKHARAPISTLVQAMNQGLRPALTKWQARYRAWLAHERNQGGTGEDPQDLQRRYPRYEEMMQDLRAVNRDLQTFAHALHLIAQRAEAEADKANHAAQPNEASQAQESGKAEGTQA